MPPAGGSAGTGWEGAPFPAAGTSWRALGAPILDAIQGVLRHLHELCCVSRLSSHSVHSSFGALVPIRNGNTEEVTLSPDYGERLPQR